MKEQLEKIKEEALRQIESSEALERLNDIRVSYLGKKGELTNLLKSMKDVAPEDRPKVGQMVNDVRGLIEGRLEEAKTALAKKAREEQLKREVIDVTLPARKNNVGHSHPNTIALEEVERIFVGMGYEVVEGPEVEYDRYNFEKLNIPKGHPARDEQDTFYINENIRAAQPDITGTGAYHGEGKASHPHDCAGPRVPFRRGGCHPLPLLPSD